MTPPALHSQRNSLFSRSASADSDVAQLVEYASGGRVVAGSSPVIPTLKGERTALLFFFALTHGCPLRTTMARSSRYAGNSVWRGHGPAGHPVSRRGTRAWSGVPEIQKQEKMDLMHVAVCTVLVPQGFYEFKGRDDDGWPHFEEKVRAGLGAEGTGPADPPGARGLFRGRPVGGHRPAKRLSAPRPE